MSLIHEFLNKSKLIPDERTQNWPLMKFEESFLITLVYVLFVLIGKVLFRPLPKMELYYIRVLHNLFMTLINLYLVIEILRQAALTSWYGPIIRNESGLGVSVWLKF